MRLPNGYGGVSKMPGKRRKPYRVRKTAGWEIVNEEAKQIYIDIGYYETKAAALKALAEYNENPYDVNAAKITLKEIYDKWSDKKYQEISQSNINGYKASWRLLEPIENKAIKEITIDHLQSIVDTCGKNHPTLRKLKVLLNALFDYAVIRGIISNDRHLVEYLDIYKKGNPNARNRTPFTNKEISTLWKNKDSNEYLSIILMLIYSGVRIGELLELKKEDVNLEERYFNINASKTQAGIRTVPICAKTIDFFKEWYHKNDCEYLLSTPEGEQLKYRNYYDSYWTPLLNTFQMEHRPHDTRHTCISLLTKAKVDERFIQLIVGHRGQNVTRQVYTHIEIQDLLTEIDKI